ncbi:MAG: site-2 protease family protein [Candidatus Woesearchaeota archaeon]|jgi:membrane-associated protease RseP (regulator of RpoE activity)
MFSGWIEKYGLVLAFYIIVIILIYLNRKRFEFQGKIVAIYKTKLGLNLMDRMANKWRRLILFIGSVGIYVGFAGMLVMIYFIGLGTYQLFFVPGAPPMFSPVIPGVSIPGSPITLPLFEGLIALFIVVVIHEFTHGVISRAYKIPVRSSGFVMFGPIPGAFVEPDEKKLKKAKLKTQLSIFAGGPFANVLLALVLFFVIIGMTAVSSSMYSPTGIEIKGFTNVSDGLEGGRLASLSEGEVVYSINNVPVPTIFNISSALVNVSPGDSVLLNTSEGTKYVVLAASPDNVSMPYLGVFLNHHVDGKTKLADNKVFSAIYFWFFGNPFDLRFNQGLGMVGWIFIISLGIGIVNLLPLGPMDGGRMYLLLLENYMDKKIAKKIWSITTMVLIFLLVVLIFIPIVRAII